MDSHELNHDVEYNQQNPLYSFLLLINCFLCKLVEYLSTPSQYCYAIWVLLVREIMDCLCIVLYLFAGFLVFHVKIVVLVLEENEKSHHQHHLL
jgi:hypothetical protein